MTNVMEPAVVAPAPDRLAMYRSVVAELAAARTRRDADLAAADAAYAAGLAEAESERSAAVSAAAEADAAAAAAASAVVAVDGEVDHLWDRLRAAFGWRAARLGQPPAPAEPPPGETARTLLDRAAAGVDALRRDRPRPPLPVLVVPLLPLLGAATATVAGLIAGALAALGQGDGGVNLVLRLMGYVAFLVAPFTGVPAAIRLADRWFGSRLDTGAIALTVLGGMLAGCALSVLLR